MHFEVEHINGVQGTKIPAYIWNDLKMQVLQSFRSPTKSDNPYIRQLASSLAHRMEVKYFSWSVALFGHYDIFHVHWPEFFFHDKTKPKILLYVLFLSFLWRLDHSKTPVIRTLHNLAPHESLSFAEKKLLARLDRLTTVWIRLNETTDSRLPLTRTVLHGHYCDWFSEHQVPHSIPGTILYFGLIRSYKGIETLLMQFQALDGIKHPGLCLRLVGKPDSHQLELEIENACRSDSRISALLRYVDDATMAVEIGHSELVVLPYKQMHNSGSLLLALSLSRPVLVPRNQANEWLSKEVGPGWIQMYDAEIDAQVIWSALQAVRSHARPSRPNLSAREWQAAGETHAAIYASAIDSVRSGR